MGFLTTIVIDNDMVHTIKDDPKFGEKVYQAVLQVDMAKPGELVPIYSHGQLSGRVGEAVETHHADTVVPVLVGAQQIRALPEASTSWGHDNRAVEEAILRRLAEKLGYRVSKKPKSGGERA